MKKIVSTVMALGMVLSMAACGSTASTTAATAEPAATTEAAEATEAPAEAAAEDSDVAYVTDKGTLVVGITDFEPMDYKDADGNWIGFDADLAKLFAEDLGVDVEFIEIEWDNKVLELNGKTIDCIWNGMTLTDEMTSAASCSNAYMRNAQVVVIAADKAADYADIESMADLTFAVEAGSAGEAAVNDLGYNANSVTSQAAALMEVAAGTSDAAVIDLLMAYAMVGEGTSYADLVYTISLEEEQYGVAFRTGSDLTEALNTYLAAAYADGTMDELAENYGLAGTVIEQ